jgi:hypothetical protein
MISMEEKEYLHKFVESNIELIDYDEVDDKYKIVTWPESQNYIGHPEAELINDEEGLDMFGSSAYVIPKDVKPIDYDDLPYDDDDE